jgi:hypothetical protein
MIGTCRDCGDPRPLGYDGQHDITRPTFDHRYDPLPANQWASPEGFTSRPPRVQYRVRDKDSGEVVVRMTALMADGAVRKGAYYHSLDHHDLHLAKSAARLLQQACGYFYADDEKYEPLEGVADIVIPDHEVRERIERMDLGENSREAERVGRKRYVLTELPWDQQRALVEQITALYREWQFEWIGEATPKEEAEYQKPTPVGTDMTDDDLRLAMGAYG